MTFIAWILVNRRIALYAGMALVCIALAAWSVHAFHARDSRLIERGRQEVRDADLAEARKVASEFATATARTERDALIQTEHRNESFAELSRVAVNLPEPIRAVRVPGAVVGLLDRAVGQANVAPGATAGPDATAAAAAEDSDLGKLTDWAVETVRVCALYRDRVYAWQSWYSNLQSIVSGE